MVFARCHAVAVGAFDGGSWITRRIEGLAGCLEVWSIVGT